MLKELQLFLVVPLVVVIGIVLYNFGTLTPSFSDSGSTLFQGLGSSKSSSTSNPSGGAHVGTATSGRLFQGEPYRTFDDTFLLFSPSKMRDLKIERKQVPDYSVDGAAKKCKKWSVVSTIFEPSDAIVRQASLGPEWCLLIVGDKKTPVNYVVPDAKSPVIFLDVDKQNQMMAEFPFISKLPWNHFGRKNIGYFYATAMGAEIIWDMDDDNGLKSVDLLQSLVSDSVYTVKRVVDHPLHLYNNYMVQSETSHNIWPRGFPLDEIKNPVTWNTTLKSGKKSAKTISVIQSLADNDPDIDALYRLTQPLPFHFKPYAASFPVVMSAKTFVPLNAQACLFKRDAFWMMYLLVTVHGRVSDIWRSYIGQKLLWNIGHQVMYTPPIVDQFRNSHNYLADFNAEIPLYEKSGKLTEFLLHWKHEDPEAPIASQLEQLYIDLYKRGYLEIEDVELIQYWILSLMEIGYDFPPVAPPVFERNDCADFKDLSLFLPLAPTDESLAEFHELFYFSYKLFWPANTARLDIILDGEFEGIQAFNQKILDSSAPTHPIRTVYGYPAPYHLSGHDRQQWLMFWADNFTTSDYIGFVDSDAVFVTRVMDSDVFRNGKPRVTSCYGSPRDGWWETVPARTEFSLGFKEPFRSMTYFPVVIKREHLKEIRDHITQHLGEVNFDMAFLKVAQTSYSQFNIFNTFLWYKKRDEYFWDLTERTIGWAGTIVGQVANKAEAGITDAMLIQNRHPRVTMHKPYEDLRGENADPSLAVKKVVGDGYCWSLQRGENPFLPKCSAINRNTVFKWQWTFEGDDYSQRAESLPAHMKRLEELDKCPPHKWNQDLLNAVKAY